MTPAIQLAKECGASTGEYRDVFTRAQLETFYARAQAQALREAADAVQDDYGSDADSAAKIRRMADDLDPPVFYAGQDPKLPIDGRG